MDIVAVIPVKGNSERVKYKNLRPFFDTSLFELKLSHLQDVSGFSDKVVSSEDDGVLEIAQDYGFSVHKRDPSYSTSSVPMSSVYSYIASEVKGENIAWVNVTNPLAEAPIYENAIEQYRGMGVKHDCLLSVYELKEYVFFKNKPVNFPPSPWPKSQDLEGTYAMSFIINILKRKKMVQIGSTVGENPCFYICDSIDSMDVDYQDDFDFCEFIYKKRREALINAG